MSARLAGAFGDGKLDMSASPRSQDGCATRAKTSCHKHALVNRIMQAPVHGARSTCGLQRSDQARGDGAALCALHHGVQIPIPEVVDCAAGPSQQQSARPKQRQQPRIRQRPGRARQRYGPEAGPCKEPRACGRARSDPHLGQASLCTCGTPWQRMCRGLEPSTLWDVRQSQ